MFIHVSGKLLFLFLFYFVGLDVSAQNNRLDSLRVRLQTLSPTDTSYILTLCLIAGEELSSNPVSAQANAEKCLKLSEMQGFATGQIYALNLLGIRQQRLGNFPAALESYLQALDIAHKSGNQERLVKTINNLGILYYSVKDYEKALSQFREALKRQREPLEIANLKANIGLSYLSTDKLDSALVYFYQALSTYVELGYERGIGSTYNNISLIYLKKGNLEQSLANLQLALTIFKKANILHGEANTLNNIGRVLTKQGRFKEAEPYLRQGMALSKQLQNLKFQVEAADHLYRLFELQGHTDSAYFWVKAYMSLKDSMTLVQQREEIEAIKLRYANEQQRKLYEKDSALQHVHLLVWRSTALFLLALFLLGVYVFWLSRRSRIAKQALQEQEIARLKIEEENQRLQKEKLTEALAYKSRELASQTIHLLQKNESLQVIADQVREVVGKDEKDFNRFRPILRLMEQSASSVAQWETFKQHFEAVHTDFFQNLMEHQPQLTAHDLRYCAYLRMNLSSKEISTLLNTSTRSVETHRYRLRKKLGLGTETDLVGWIMQV